MQLLISGEYIFICFYEKFMKLSFNSYSDKKKQQEIADKVRL